MNIHVGQIIESKFQESGIKLSVFAERINTGERNVYSIFKRKDINAGMLKVISEVLDFNFFDLYAPSAEQRKNVVEDGSITLNLGLKIDRRNIESLPTFLSDLDKLAQKQGIQVI